ncbi:MAG: 3-deoxy-D-manno-octulosonic acid transferase [Bacteroidales bacterium]|nr:3-deoxy-D-manno-octulosonic acid transferase [Bacteroidales bacterium]
MIIFYNIVIRCYYLLIYLTSFFNKKAKLWINGRKTTAIKIKHSTIDKSKKTIWFHVSSLGEFEQGRPLIEKIKKNYNVNIVITFFSPSGYEIRKNYEFADLILYLPLDTKKNARQFLNFINPDIVIFIKYDLWYHFICEVHRRNIPLYLVSAVFTKDHICFKWYGAFYRKILRKFTTIFTQDENSKELLTYANIKQVKVAGDTRCERVIQIANKNYSNTIIEDFIKSQQCIILGSIWLNDMKIASPIIRKYLNYKWIIVPHEVSEKNIKKICKKLKVPVTVYSSYPENNTTNVLIVDTIGILSKIYRYANIVYVGGGFGKGIHNILEPAVYGVPVIFGPNNKKFIEAYFLKKCKGGFEIHTSSEFEEIMLSLLNNNDYRIECGKAAKNYIYQNCGNINKILNEII